MTRRMLQVALAAVLVAAPLVRAQENSAQQQPAAKPFKPEELEQIVAPIALYPDALVAQVMMAATYPLEVIQAARFAKDNPKLTGDALNQALTKQSWDDSVKSLVSFPQILAMMNDKLDWLQKLGDAFLAQQKDAMDAVQRLRAKAQASGNLKSNEQQKVTVEPAEAAAPAPPPSRILSAADKSSAITRLEALIKAIEAIDTSQVHQRHDSTVESGDELQSGKRIDKHFCAGRRTAGGDPEQDAGFLQSLDSLHRPGCKQLLLVHERSIDVGNHEADWWTLSCRR